MHRHEPSFLRLALGLLALVPVAVLPPHAMALPSGPQVVSGRVDFSQAASQALITQHTKNAIVNWRSFDIGASESVRLSQLNAQAALLARVTGGDPTRLLGQLQADGKLFLINERGILVGAGARIDTAAFLASTLDVSDSDFLRGNQLVFKGDSSAGIVNLGSINAREGNVLLFAHTVKNAGDISAPKGAAALAAGTEVLLASADSPDFLIKANLPAETPAAVGVDNSGVIAAAQARLEAAGGSLYELAVNQSGVIRATGSARLPDGRVVLTAAGGHVSVSGTVTARDASGSGGEILVGGDYRGQTPSVANAARTTVTSTAHLSADAAKSAADSGRVIVWADHTTTFEGTLSARGARGGFAEVSGKRLLHFHPATVLDLGKNGLLLLDPDELYVGDADPGLPGVSFMSVDTLEAQLAVGDVLLDTTTFNPANANGDITIGDAVTWTGNHTLTLRSGNSIFINADITGGPGSTLELFTGLVAPAPLETSLPDILGEATLDSAATITVGTLTYGTHGLYHSHPGYTPEQPEGAGRFFADGTLDVGLLRLDLRQGSAGISTGGSDNTIRAFETLGDADFFAYVENHHGNLDVTFNNSTKADGRYLQFFTPGNLTLKAGSHLDFANPDGTVILASTAGAFINEAGASAFGPNTRYLIYTSTTAATTKGGLTGTNIFNHPYDENDDDDGLGSTFFFSGSSASPLLTYSANDASRRYGAANPAFTYTVSGWEDGVADDVTGAPALSTTATVSSGVDHYVITISAGTLASSNYDFAFQNGTLSVNRATLTIRANDASRRVGLANPAFSASYTGFVLGEDASVLGGVLGFSTPANSASPVGPYTITPSGLTSANYAITFAPGTLTINATASLLITANNASRVYGALNPAFSATYQGFVGGEDETLVHDLQFSTAATQTSGRGFYTITPFGATAAGYDISYAPGTLEITRAPLTISIPNQSRVYGDANDFLVNYNGLVLGEQAADVISGLDFDTLATRSSFVGNYTVTPYGATADNYAISFTSGTLTITAAPLTVFINPASRRYGDADPAFSYSVSGLKNGDSESSVLTVGPISSTASATDGVGSYGTLAFPFVSSPNYTVAPQATGTLTITPRPLTITADNKTRLYGDPNPAFTATFAGLASFDTPSLFGPLPFSTQATQASGVGNWGITFATVSNPNYTITPVFGTLSITPAPLTYAPLAALSRLYGRANPDMTLPAVDGLKLTDTLQSLGLAFETPAPAADAGDYTYRLTTTNPNYELASGIGAFRIDPAPLTVAITPTGRLYGDANPATYQFTANGLAFGQTAASVITINNTASIYSDVGVYSLIPVLNTGNYTLTGITGGSFQINPRVVTLDLPYYARYYGDLNPVFFNGDIAVGGHGLASFDNIAGLVPELRTAAPTTSLSDTGYYRIDPVFAANPNYRYSWTPGYLAVMPRPVEIRVGDGVSFGHNNVPREFSPSPDISLITFDAEHPTGTGYHVEILNLPPGADLATLLRYVLIGFSNENTPQPVGFAVPLDQVPFPARPGYTPPVAPGDPLPPDADLGIKTIQLTQVLPPQPTELPTLEALLRNFVFSGGEFIVDHTGTVKDERFADSVRYLIPRASLGGNYVITAFHNGKLTGKADPDVVRHTLEAEANYKQLKDAREAILTGHVNSDGSVQRTFNLTQNEFPLIYEAFANLLFDLVNSDRSNPLLQELTGFDSVASMDMISPDAIALWLADIHTNPYKQKMLLPAMTSYGIKIAGLKPSERTPLQQQLVERMTPALQEARNEFIDRAVDAQKAWGEMQYGNTNLMTLYGAEVPYEKFISSAVQKTVDEAYSFKHHDDQALSETEMNRMLGLGVGGAAGITAGTVMGKIAASSFNAIFPEVKAAISIALDEGVDATVQALNAMKGARTVQTANFVGGVVSMAVTIGIEKAIAVANEGRQKESFEALVNSRKDPINVYDMSNSKQGRAVLAAGLMSMFGG